MGENVADRLLRLAGVLHWLGKYEECNELIMLSRLMRVRDIETTADLVRMVEVEEQKDRMVEVEEQKDRMVEVEEQKDGARGT